MSVLTRNKISLVCITACNWLILSALAQAQFDAPPPPPSLTSAVATGAAVETAEAVAAAVQPVGQESPPALPVELKAAPAPKATAPAKRVKAQPLAKTRSQAVPSTARRPFISRLIRSRKSGYPYGAPLIRTTVALPKTTAENPPIIKEEAADKPAASKWAGSEKKLREKFGSLTVVTTKAELKSVTSRTAVTPSSQAQAVVPESQPASPIQSVLRQPSGVVDPAPQTAEPIEPTIDPVMAFAKPIRDPGAGVVGNSLATPTVDSPTIQLASYEEIPIQAVSQPLTCSQGCCDLAPAGAPSSTAVGALCGGCDGSGCDGGGCDSAGGCQGGSCGPLGCGGLCGRIGGCLADLATPTFAMPLGSSVNAFVDAQVSNAAKAQSVMYHYDFEYANGVPSAQLSEAGKRKLRRITSMGSTGYPIAVQPVPGRADVSEARRIEVENFMVSQLGFTGSQVVVAEAGHRGLRGVEAIEIDRNQLQNTRSFGSLGGGNQFGGSAAGGVSQQQSQTQTQRR